MRRCAVGSGRESAAAISAADRAFFCSATNTRMAIARSNGPSLELSGSLATTYPLALFSAITFTATHWKRLLSVRAMATCPCFDEAARLLARCKDPQHGSGALMSGMLAARKRTSPEVLVGPIMEVTAFVPGIREQVR